MLDLKSQLLTKNKQQMENRIHHEPDIRLLPKVEGLSICEGKKSRRGTVLWYSSTVQRISSTPVVTLHGPDRERSE